MITAEDLKELALEMERRYMIVLHAQLKAEEAETAWREALKEWYVQMAQLDLRRTRQGW